jgi:hypothetical protein
VREGWCYARTSFRSASYPKRYNDGCLPRNSYDYTHPSLIPSLTRAGVSSSIYDITARLLHDLSHTLLEDLQYEPKAQSQLLSTQIHVIASFRGPRSDRRAARHA